jgi:hypothetical protein
MSLKNEGKEIKQLKGYQQTHFLRERLAKLRNIIQADYTPAYPSFQKNHNF